MADSRKKDEALAALEGYGSYKSAYQDQINTLTQNLTNRQPFSYDVNKDALYKQYRDQYMRQGKLAMQDTMGQAAALTGGYGNSYAATVGNQAYQGYLSQLNDRIPQLYQLALDQYNQQGDAMKNNLALLRDQDATDYSRWEDGRQRLQDLYNIAYNQWRADVSDEQAAARRAASTAAAATPASTVTQKQGAKNLGTTMSFGKQTGGSQFGSLPSTLPQLPGIPKSASGIKSQLNQAMGAAALKNNNLAAAVTYYAAAGASNNQIKNIVRNNRRK